MATITVTVADEKLAKFKAGVLRKQPVDINEETGEPIMSEGAWLKHLIRSYMQRLYEQGAREILAAAQESEIDTEILT